MKKRDLKITVLRLLMTRDLHGYEIGRQLSMRGMSGQLSYIYQVLSEMKKERLIRSVWRKGRNGRKRKVYSLDSGGRRELQAMLRSLVSGVHEFYVDYLVRLPPEKWLLKWIRMITDVTHLFETKTAVYVATKPHALRTYQLALEYASDRIRGEMYLITDKTIGFDLNLKNLVAMSGNHAEIPLRRDFADVVVAFDPPRPEALHDAVAEFHRVVKNDGVAAIGYPNIEEQEDPLTIGAFIERIQYGLKESLPDEKTIRSVFTSRFRSVNVSKAADFTFFVGRGKNQKR